MEEFGLFSLTPMSAGDIIDRAVRLYRRHFLVLLRVVIAPSLVSYFGGILYTTGSRNFSLERGDTRTIVTVFMVIAGILLYIAGKVVFFALLGGISRALVNYFAWGAPLRARSVFQTVRARWWQMIGASIVVLFLLAGVIMMTYMILLMVILIYVGITTWILMGLPTWIQVITHSIFALIGIAGLLVIGLLVYGRVVFIPQALMVEEKSVFSAVARSIALAGGDFRRVGAILLFQIYVAWSFVLLLLIPLGWYGYLNGIDVNPFGGTAPLWYNIAQQTLTQISEILLAPIAMVSFTLLYLDVRVRREGFDVELLANRQLPPARHIVEQQPSQVERQPSQEVGV